MEHVQADPLGHVDLPFVGRDLAAVITASTRRGRNRLVAANDPSGASSR